LNTEVPSSLRAAFRIKDVMAEAVALDLADASRAAVSYLKRLGVTAATPLPPGLFYRHRNLRYWASRAGSFPALLGLADDGVNRALLATFLTPYGELAPVREPQLLLGAANGACLRLSRACGEDHHLWLAQSLDDALRLFVRHPGDGVYCAMAFANLGKIQVPQNVSRVSIVIRNGSAGARDDLRAAIAMQGARADVLSSDEALGRAMA
jgi:hypothetical protein